MNHSDWMRASIPQFEEASSVETYRVIRQAMKQTLIHRLALWLAVFLSALVLAEGTGSLFSVSLFEGVQGNILACAAFFIAFCIIEPLNKRVVRRRIQQLAQQKQAPGPVNC